MAEGTRFTSHEAYIAAAPEGRQEALRRVQAAVEAAVPGAERCIGYNMPAYRLGKLFFYFAAFRQHLGIYPPVRDDAVLIGELAPYRNEKGNLGFRFSEPVPYGLIGRVAAALAKEYAGTLPKGASTRRSGADGKRIGKAGGGSGSTARGRTR